MQQKVRLAGGDIACDHFGQLRHRLYKCVRVGIGVTFNIHANKRDYAQADFFAIEARSVTFNETVFLKPANLRRQGDGERPTRSASSRFVSRASD